MIVPGADLKIYMATRPVDFRRGLDGLAAAAQEILGMEPEERDAIRDWAIEQKLMPRTRKEAGEFIHLAPGKMVGRYANGDIVRTRKLFAKCWPEVVVERGMSAAYDRDRRLHHGPGNR